MAPAINFKKAYWVLVAGGALYFGFLSLLTNTWVQRQALYVHKVHTIWWEDPNKPELFGFLKSQVQPFTISTKDNETLYAWHVLPLGKYTQNEQALLKKPFDARGSFVDSVAFDLLYRDPTSRLVINFHGNAGTVAQGWRTDTYRGLSSGAPDNIHVVAIDYRGFGYSSGAPDEQGLVMDGIAAVEWAMDVAGIPPERIALVGQSLGTAVAAAVAEHFVRVSKVEFAGVLLAASFSDMQTLLLTYSAKGVIPILSPLRPYPKLQRFFSRYLKDSWDTSSRIESLVRHSDTLNLHLIHAKNDFEIPWKHSETLFYTAANATSDSGLSTRQIDGVKFHQDLQEGGTVDSWNAGGTKKITKRVVKYGGKSEVRPEYDGTKTTSRA
ncbi:MAG: hypothetical protein Q9174_005888 [Haloplaca sp. 1 TL-2023]